LLFWPFLTFGQQAVVSSQFSNFVQKYKKLTNYQQEKSTGESSFNLYISFRLSPKTSL